MVEKNSNMKKGDIVIVDEGYRNGGYEAELMWVGNLFARIKCGDDEWDIMKNRLKLKKNEFNDRPEQSVS